MEYSVFSATKCTKFFTEYTKALNGYICSGFCVTFENMIPDYPHKLFADKRNNYSLLMLTLAMDSES